jgi:hypothetical protein
MTTGTVFAFAETVAATGSSRRKLDVQPCDAKAIELLGHLPAAGGQS